MEVSREAVFVLCSDSDSVSISASPPLNNSRTVRPHSDAVRVPSAAARPLPHGCTVAGDRFHGLLLDCLGRFEIFLLQNK